MPATIFGTQQRAAMTHDDADLCIGESDAGERAGGCRAHSAPGLRVLIGDQNDTALANGNKVLAVVGDV
ncbi:hypothetical protein D3C76_855760 [compost metagenome]